MTPRPYLSYSQMVLFDKSPEEYYLKYFDPDHKERKTVNMAYGSKMADGLENDELTGDPILDLVMTQIPKFERRDKIIEWDDGIEVEYEYDHKKYRIPFLEDKN